MVVIWILGVVLSADGVLPLDELTIRGRDELAQTAGTFNRMSLDLQQSYRQLNDAL